MKKILILVGCLFVILGGIYFASNKNNAFNTFDTDISELDEWVISSESSYFKFTPMVLLKPAVDSKIPHLIFEIKIENKTKQPIYDLQATVFLRKEIASFISSPLLVFGNTKDETVDLVPGEIPYALSTGRITGIPRYNELSPKEHERLLETIKLPIRVKISYVDSQKKKGVEYLEIQSEDIVIVNELDKETH